MKKDKIKKDDWLGADEKEIRKIEKMVEKKEAKELGKWLEKWEKEGRFW